MKLPTIAMAMLLAGCASTHGMAPATAPMDADALAAQRSLAGDASATFPDLEWWRAFGDPQLDALVAEALAGSPSLLAADAQRTAYVAILKSLLHEATGQQRRDYLQGLVAQAESVTSN